MSRLIEDSGIATRTASPVRLAAVAATSESRRAGDPPGADLMVVEAEKTSQEAVREALSHIQSCEVVACC